MKGSQFISPIRGRISPEKYQELQGIKPGKMVKVEDATKPTTKGLIGGFLIQQQEEDVVPILQEAYGKFGFEFDESGITGDYMTVKSKKTGRTTEISLDNLTDNENINQAKKLEEFIQANAGAAEFADTRRLAALSRLNKNSEFKMLYDPAKLKAEQYKLNDELNGAVKQKEEIKKLEKDYLSRYKEFEKQVMALGGKPMPFELQMERQALQQASSSIQQLSKDYNKQMGTFAERKQDIEQLMAAEFELKAQKGDALGALYNSFLKGYGSLAAGSMDLGIDVALEAQNALGMFENADEMDKEKKRLKKNILPVLRNEFVERIGADTSEEYIQDVQKNNFVGGAILSLAQSAPAMIASAPLTGGLGSILKGATALTRAGQIGLAATKAAPGAFVFGLQSSDFINQEMEKNPAFANISERERWLVKAPLAVVNGVLENFGFRNAVKLAPGVVASFTKKALSKLGKKQGLSALENITKEEVKRAIRNGSLKKVGSGILAGGLAEFETETLQQLSEVAIKDLYNTAKGKEMFKDVDFFSMKTLKEGLYAGAQGAIGGKIMSAFSAVPQGVQMYSLGNKMTDEQFKLVNEIVLDPELRNLMVANFKNDILSGKMNYAEASKQIAYIEQAASTFSEIPNTLNEAGRRAAFDLINEKKDLEKEISGKDTDIVAKQTERIAEIKNELKEISKSEEYAIQEPSTEGVDVRQQASDGETVGVRDTQEGQEVQDDTQDQEQVAPEQQITDEELTRYKPKDDEAELNDQTVLNKTLEKFKVEAIAEPNVMDLGDAVVFEYTQADDSITRLTFKKKKNGEISSQGVKVSKDNATSLEGTTTYNEAVQKLREQQVLPEQELDEDIQKAVKAESAVLQEQLKAKQQEEGATVEEDTQQPKLRVQDEMDAPLNEKDIETISREMTELGAEQMNLSEEDVADQQSPKRDEELLLDLNALKESKAANLEKELAKLGLEIDDATSMLEDWDGVPFMMAMSDMLASGEIKDSQGNSMDVEGGGLFNTVGPNKELAWAGVVEEDTVDMISKARKVYADNKEYFDRWWKQNPKYAGHIPVMVMRMADNALNSNEATFRWLAPTIKKFPLANRKAALQTLIETIKVSKPMAKIKKNQTISIADKYLNFIKENKIKTLDQFLLALSKNAEQRAKAGVKNLPGTFTLDERSAMFNIIFSNASNPSTASSIGKALVAIPETEQTAQYDKVFSKLDDATAIAKRLGVSEEQAQEFIQAINEGNKRKANSILKSSDFKSLNRINIDKSQSKDFINYLTKKQQYTNDAKNLNISNVYEGLGEPAFKDLPQGSTMAVMGIELAKTNNKGEVVYKEGEIIDVAKSAKSKHHNYHSGPKGKFLSFISNPRHGMAVFPEMRAKLAATYKEKLDTKTKQPVGLPTTEAAAQQTTSNFYTDKAFVGGKLTIAIDDTALMVGRLRNVFPEIATSLNKTEFDEFIKQDDIRTRVSGDQVIYGVTKDNKIYINPEVATVGTALHEFGHVWMSYLKEQNKPLYDKGISLAKKAKEEYARQEAKYRPIYEREGMSESEIEALIAEEVLVELIATKGETIKAAGIKAGFKSWLNAMYKYIQKTFKLSRLLTISEIENMSIQQFTETALADMILTDDKKARKLNSFRPAFEEGKSSLAKFSVVGGMTPAQIIAYGRQERFTESSIIDTLKATFPNLGMTEIRQALAFTTPGGQLMLFRIPDSFGDVEGGIAVGSQMIEDIRKHVYDYVNDFKDSKKYAPTTNQIRNEAINFLKKHKDFQELKGNSTLQKQLILDLDAMISGQLDIKNTSKTLQAQLDLLKKQIYQRNRGSDVLRNAIKRVESMLRQELPKADFTSGELKKALSILKRATPTTFESKWVELTGLVDKIENRLKREATKAAIKRYNKLSETVVQSGKRKSKRRVDENGIEFFKQAEEVLTAFYEQDANAIKKIEKSLFDENGDILESVMKAQEKVAAGNELNEEERKLLAKFNAYEVFHNINDISYQDAQDLFDIYKDFESAYRELMQGKLMQRAKEMRELKEAAATNLEETSGDLLFTGESKFSNLTAEENNTYREKVLKKWEKDTQSKDGAVVGVDGKNFKVIKQYNAEGNEVAPQIQVTRKILKDNNTFDSEFKDLHQRIMDATYDVDSPVSRFMISIKETYNHIIKMTKDLAKGQGPIYRLASSPIKNLPTYLNAMDGATNKFFKEKIYDNLNRMHTDSLRGYYTQVDLMSEIANDIFQNEEGLKGAQKVAGQRESAVAIRMANGKERVFKGTVAMRIYALSKNEGVRKKMITNNQGDAKFTKDGLDDLANKLDPRLKALVDRTVDYLSNQYFEETNRAYENLNFVSLDKIENYFPLVTDSTNANASVIDKAIGQGDFQGAFSAQYIAPIKRRVDTQGAVSIDNSLGFFNSLDNHFKDVEKFKSYGQGVMEINAIISSPAVSRYLELKGTKGMVKDLLNFAINPDAVAKTMFNNPFANFLYNAYTLAALGYRPIQALKQASSFVAAYDSYEFKPGASELENMMGFLYDMGRVVIEYRSYVEKARKMSPDFRARMDTMNVAALESFYADAPSSRLMKEVHNIGGYFIRQGDIAGVMGYMANYIRDKENGMSDREALEKFNNYNDTQQSRRPQDLTWIQANKNLLYRGITMFGTTAFLQMNAMMQTANNIFIKTKFKPWNADKKDVKRFIVQGIAANVLYYLVGNFAKILFATTDEDEEEFYEELITKYVIPINVLQTSMIFFGNSIAYAKEIAMGKNPWDAAKTLRTPINPMIDMVGRSINKGTKEGFGPALMEAQKMFTGVNLMMAEGIYGLTFGEDGYVERDWAKILGIGKSSLPTPIEEMDLIEILNPEQARIQKDLDKAMEEIMKKYPDMSEEKEKELRRRIGEARGLPSF